MRVFCPEHKRGFFAPRQSPIKCENRGHVLGELDFEALEAVAQEPIEAVAVARERKARTAGALAAVVAQRNAAALGAIAAHEVAAALAHHVRDELGMHGTARALGGELLR